MPDLNLSFLDLVVLAGYLGGMALMGVWFSRKNTSTEEYFVGGRSFPGWAIGLSMVGTSISSVTFLAFPGDAYKTGWLRFLPNLMLPVAILIAAYVFLPFFRRGNLTTAYEYLESRFGPSVRLYAAAAFIIGQLFRVSIILYLISLVVHEMTGLDPTLCIFVGGVFVAFYTVVGGIDAVVWTDVIQTIVLVVGGLICMVYIVGHLPGGLGEIFSVASEHGKFALAEVNNGVAEAPSWGLSFSEKTITMMLLLGLMAYLTEYCSNQNIVQRYVATKSTKEARRAMFICAATSVPIWAFFMFLGTSLYVYYQAFPDPRAAEMLTGVRKAEQVLPYFIMTQLPPGVAGLVIAAALAAAMSSLDSSINAISTVGVVDIYRRHLVKTQADSHYLKAAWGIATFAAVFMIGGAIVLAKLETRTLQDTATIIASLLAGGMLGVFFIGFFTRRGDARSVWLGIACSFTFTLWTVVAKHRPGVLPEALAVPFDLYYTGLIGNVIMFIIGYLGGVLLPAKPRDLTRLTVWDQQVVAESK
jgi:solute:Na+ symporter, SSS family